MARGWRRDRGSRSVGDPSALAGTAEAWDEDEDDGGGFGRWGIVRQVASVVLVAAIIGGLGVVALTGGAVVPDSPGPTGPTKVLDATTTRGRATVPSVVGLSQVYAMEVLRKAGVTGVISVSRPDERVGKGKIANQIPAADTAVERGSQVELALSLGPEDRPVPNLVGYPANGALTLLERAGMGFTVQVEPSDQPSGTVLRTQPTAGEKRPKGTTVLLVLSGGPSPLGDLSLLAGLVPGGSWPDGPMGEQAGAPVTTGGTTSPTAGRPTVTLPPRVTTPPTTRPPSSPPTTRPPAPTPTTRPPTTQPSGPQCVTYPARTYWDEVDLRWVRVPMSTVCV